MGEAHTYDVVTVSPPLSPFLATGLCGGSNSDDKLVAQSADVNVVN